MVSWTFAMPAVTLPLLSVGVGLFLSWSCRAPEGGSAAFGQALWHVVAYALLVHAPAAAALLAQNPDWSFAYLLPPSRWQTAGILAASLCVAFAVPFGFLLGTGGHKRRASLGWVYGAAALLGACALNTLLFIGPITKDASYVEYHNAFGVGSVAGGALGYSLMWAVVVVGSALLFTHANLRRISQEDLPGSGTHGGG